MTLPPSPVRPARIGLVVNPVAGIGGPAALKGSDGVRVQELARLRGGASRAIERAAEAIGRLPAGTRVLTSAGAMGQASIEGAGCVAEVVHRAAGPVTTADDTRSAVEALVAAGCALVLFTGGDGTATDVATVLGRHPGVAALGVPSGVKMYSACFAVSPAVAGRMAAAWLAAPHPELAPRQVLDIDEEQVRHGRVVPRVFGELLVPIGGGRTQARKVAAGTGLAGSLAGIADTVAAKVRQGSWLLGPGSTVESVAGALGITKTPLGFDVVVDGELVLSDATADQLLDHVAARPSRAVLTIIGGQGFLLGRGNQQLSGPVLARLAPDPLVVVATPDKLQGLAGPLLIDTGDQDLDRQFAGYYRVITGVQDAAVVRAIPASADRGTTDTPDIPTTPTLEVPPCC